MRLFSLALLLLWIISLRLSAQNLDLPEVLQQQDLHTKQSLLKAMQKPEFKSWQQLTAQQLLAQNTLAITEQDKLKLHMLTNKLEQGLCTKTKPADNSNESVPFIYQLYVLTLCQQKNEQTPAIQAAFNELVSPLSDRDFIAISEFAGYDLGMGEDYLFSLFNDAIKSLSSQQTLYLLTTLQDFYLYQTLLPYSDKLLKQEFKRRFLVGDDLLIQTKGASVSATLVRSKSWQKPMPTAMQMTIYSDDIGHLREAAMAVTYGYVGLIVDSRGKRLSKGPIIPYEYDGQDAARVINWVSKQNWSDGQVGMHGGSYLGFSQWATAKYMPQALKTIVPYVPNNPAQGLPYENNVYITANYQWPFFVTNNQYLDYSVYGNPNEWRELMGNWYNSGKPFAQLDKIHEQANPWFQLWLKHPSYDAYWQNMQPYQKDFAKITIPVLSLNGYYDDGNFSAQYYYFEHLKYQPDAEHYWLIGPYDHRFSLQNPLRGYALDEVANINRNELTYAWFDYVMKAAPLPALLKDKVTYQLMGSNSWQYASSLQALNQQSRRYYLSNQAQVISTHPDDQFYQLTTEPAPAEHLSQTIDLADRSTSTNTEAYPWPIIREQLEDKSGVFLVTEVFEHDMQIAGSFAGELQVQINKHDFDYGLTFYQVMPDGKLFHLSFTLGRASYAKDPSKRQLLSPNKLESVPFSHSRMTAKKLEQGSRILVILNVNKNSSAQVNMGTGQDVSQESATDSKVPLTIDWLGTTYIDMPLTQAKQKLAEK
ncbi:CocE/NonD family hydrolase [Paraglaciecola sp.]|uniref:CocE/NonD family hydrolase n=1 Tax=Paraglaciecola sp. TaxID=1920173 RepID=UPI0030F47408